MDVFLKILNWFVINILTKPEFFIGIIVFVGYMLLKKPVYESFAGFLKATVGFMILMVGASGLVTTFRPILAALKVKFEIDAAVIDPYFGLAAVNAALKGIGQSASNTMIALCIGFAVNITLIIFRKITRVRSLFITGHVMLQQATTATWIVFSVFPELRNTRGTILVGILVGLYWAAGSNLTVEPTQRLTNGSGFAIGHQQMFSIWLADKIAAKVGNPKKRVADIKLPKALSIFHDNVVATGTLMMFFFGAILMFLGPDLMSDPKLVELTGDKAVAGILFDKKVWYGTYIISTSLKFSVYLAVLMMGVRMFVTELTQAFQGISSRLLPGSLPAVDCAASYNFAHPNAILFGFATGLVSQLTMIALLIIFKSPILIITGFVPVFFDNATLAVYADKRGGVRAAVIVAAICGSLQVIGGAIAVYLFQLAGGWHGNIDWATAWPFFGFIMKNLGYIGIALVAIILLAIPQLQYARAKDKEAYFRAEVDPID